MRFEGSSVADDAGACASARMPPTNRMLRLAAVNGWRGPGAIGIALGHLLGATDMVAVDHLTPLRLIVDMFFVFSGVVIAQTYSQKLRRPAAIPEYVLRRFGRIWPLQAATLAVLVAYETAKLVLVHTTGRHFSSPPFDPNGINTLWSIPTNLLLIHGLGIHDRETWNFPSWSLSVEFATYLLFAALCLLRPGTRWLLSVVTIGASLTILGFVSPTGMNATFDFGVFRCLAGFLAGTLCYEVAIRWPPPRLPFPTLVEIAAVIATGAWVVAAQDTAMSLAAPLVFSLFILAFVGEHGLVSRLLATRPMQYLAELSFAIYMVHALILLALFAAMHEIERLGGPSLFTTIVEAGHGGTEETSQLVHLHDPVSKWAMTLLYLAGVLLASVLANTVVEGPGRAFFGRIGRRMSRTRTDASATARPNETLPGKAP